MFVVAATGALAFAISQSESHEPTDSWVDDTIDEAKLVREHAAARAGQLRPRGARSI